MHDRDFTLYHWSGVCVGVLRTVRGQLRRVFAPWQRINVEGADMTLALIKDALLLDLPRAPS